MPSHHENDNNLVHRSVKVPGIFLDNQPYYDFNDLVKTDYRMWDGGNWNWRIDDRCIWENEYFGLKTSKWSSHTTGIMNNTEFCILTYLYKQPFCFISESEIFHLPPSIRLQNPGQWLLSGFCFVFVLFLIPYTYPLIDVNRKHRV